MSELVVVALIAGGSAVAAAVAPTLLGFSNRRRLITAVGHASAAAVAATEVAATVGERNGNGDVVAMLTAVLTWQDAHAADDRQKMANIEAEVAALSIYSHSRFHDVLNALTITKGKTDLLWMQYEQEGKTK